MIKINATILEDGLVEDLEKLIKENKELFKDSQVALMPDAHKTNSIPVGFTMTVPHYRVAPDFISSDISCGMSSILIKDWQPTERELKNLSFVVRDLIQVNRRYDQYYNGVTDLGTLGSGNHFIEIGINEKDTLITVHSGSRNLGGDTFKKWKKIAQQQYKDLQKEATNKMLETIPPKKRQEWLLKNKPKPRKIDYVDLSLDERLMDDFEIDYYNANQYALDNRRYILNTIAQYFELGKKQLNSILINCTHNYIDFDENPWVIRKGSIKAVHGDTVIIPINMRDGIIIGDVTERGEFNNSLPHGAGRILSRTKAFEKLDIEQFKNDMKDVVSSTVVYETLDESPRAYKDINTILDDIGDGLDNVRVFKSVFNYKGV